MEKIITFTLTEQDVREIVDGAGGGDAIGECPMNEAIAGALVREFANEIAADLQDYAEGLVARLADRHARITDPLA